MKKLTWKVAVRIIAALAAVCLLFMAGSVAIPRVFGKKASTKVNVERVDTTPVQPPDNPEDAPEGYQLYAQNDRLQLYVDEWAGDFIVRDSATGRDWLSNPPADTTEVGEQFSGMDKFRLFSNLIAYTVALDDSGTNVTQEMMMVSRTASVNQGALTVSAIPDGAKLDYNFPMAEVTIPLLITLNEDGISASVDTHAIQEGPGEAEEEETEEEADEENPYGDDGEDDPLLNRVLWFSVLPYFGAGGPEDEGYLMIPDGSGALVRFGGAKGNYKTYHEPLYGTNPTYQGVTRPPLTDGIRLPVFGIRNNQAACLGIVTQGDGSAYLDAQSGNMLNEWTNVYTTFNVFGLDNVLIGQSSDGLSKEVVKYDFKNRLCDYAQVRYVLLDDGRAEYEDMAAAYRQYLEQTGLTAKFAEETAPPLFVNVFGGLLKQESTAGFLVNRYKVATSFDQAYDIARELTGLGADQLYLSYSNWTSDSVRRAFPDKARPAAQLGGMSGARRLAGRLEDLGAGLFFEYDPYAAASNANGYIGFLDSAKKIGGQTVQIWDYDRAALIWRNVIPGAMLPNPALLTGYLSRYAGHFEKNLSAGLYYPTLASLLYTNHSDGSFVSRQASRQITEQSLEIGGRGAMASFPNAYALPYVDYATEVPSAASQFNIFDEDIPLYQLVTSGFLRYSTPSVNLGQDVRDMILYAIETGSGLHFRFVYNNPEMLMETRYDYLYGAYYRQWKDDAVAAHSEVLEAFDQIGNSMLTGHRRVTGDVTVSVFGNGKRVAVNYGDGDYSLDGVTVPAKGWKVL